MADKNIPYAYLPEALNLFQDTRVMPDGSIERFSSAVKPGDKVVLRAHQDVIAVGSACPMIGPDKAAHHTDIRFVVHA